MNKSVYDLKKGLYTLKSITIACLHERADELAYAMFSGLR